MKFLTIISCVGAACASGGFFNMGKKAGHSALKATGLEHPKKKHHHHQKKQKHENNHHNKGKKEEPEKLVLPDDTNTHITFTKADDQKVLTDLQEYNQMVSAEEKEADVVKELLGVCQSNIRSIEEHREAAIAERKVIMQQVKKVYENMKKDSKALRSADEGILTNTSTQPKNETTPTTITKKTGDKAKLDIVQTVEDIFTQPDEEVVLPDRDVEREGPWWDEKKKRERALSEVMDDLGDIFRHVKDEKEKVKTTDDFDDDDIMADLVDYQQLNKLQRFTKTVSHMLSKKVPDLEDS